MSSKDVRQPIPQTLRDEYAEWEWQVVWQLSTLTVTFRLSHPTGPVRYLKIAPTSWFPSLSAEAARMQWARAYLPVPQIVDMGCTPNIDWLITKGLPGLNATDDTLSVNPHGLVGRLAQGLRQFHQTPVGNCPFPFHLDIALAHVERRAIDGLIDPARDFHSEHQHLTITEVMARLVRDRPSQEDLVVCHGDYCFPNVLIENDAVVGFVDLGELGVADRWWDLAVATWSTVWNLGEGYEEAFLHSYGIALDRPRMDYYRLLYDLVS